MSQESPFVIEDPRRLRLILVVVGLSLVMVISAVSGLNIALPDLARDTGATQSEMQWIVDAYTVTLAGLLFTSGAIGDRYGRKWLLVSGLAVFGIAAGCAVFTHEPIALIACRAVMGVGAAMVMPTTLSIITTSFPAPKRPQAVGVWIGLAGGGAVVGLVASGLLLEWFSWSSFFALNVVLAIAALVLALPVIPDSVESTPPPLDPVGAVLSIFAVGGIVFGAIEGPVQGWTDPSTIAAFVVGVAAAVLFLVWGLKARDPLLDPRLFTLRGYGTGFMSNLAQYFAAFGFFFFASQYLQFVAGFSPLKAAVSMLPMAVVTIPVARFSPQIAIRAGFNRVGALGLVAMAVGFLIIAQVGVDLEYWIFALGLMVFGAGMALAGGPATTAITESLPPARQGIASSSNDTSRELGSALGIAILGSVLNSAYRSHLAPELSRVPERVANAAESSIAAAQAIAEKVGGPAQALAVAADQAFVNGVKQALFTGVGVLVIGALVVFFRAPRKGAHPGSGATQSGLTGADQSS